MSLQEKVTIALGRNSNSWEIWHLRWSFKSSLMYFTPMCWVMCQLESSLTLCLWVIHCLLEELWIVVNMFRISRLLEIADTATHLSCRNRIYQWHRRDTAPHDNAALDLGKKVVCLDQCGSLQQHVELFNGRWLLGNNWSAEDNGGGGGGCCICCVTGCLTAGAVCEVTTKTTGIIWLMDDVEIAGTVELGYWVGSDYPRILLWCLILLMNKVMSFVPYCSFSSLIFHVY